MGKTQKDRRDQDQKEREEAEKKRREREDDEYVAIVDSLLQGGR